MDLTPSFVFCLIVLVLEIVGLSMSIRKRKWKVFLYYTQLSNMLTAVSALLLMVFSFLGIRAGWVTVLRYLSTCMLVTTCVLIPMGGDPKRLLWSGNGLFHHILCPVLSSFSYIGLEEHAGPVWIWLPVAVTLVYGLLMLFLNWKRKISGPYPFFRVYSQTARDTVKWMTALVFLIFLIAFFVWLAGR